MSDKIDNELMLIVGKNALGSEDKDIQKLARSLKYLVFQFSTLNRSIDMDKFGNDHIKEVIAKVEEILTK